MKLIKEVAKLIGWLAGALTGITAIMYAFGYLIAQTQLHLLGIDALLPSGREYYLREGANFFIVTGQKLGLVVLGLIALVVIGCIPLSILTKSEKGARGLARMKERLLGTGQKHQWLWQAAILLLLVILLFFPLVHNLDLFRAPLGLSGLLYTAQDLTPPQSLSSDSSTVWKWVSTGDTKRLNSHYYSLLIHFLFAGFLMVAVQRVTSSWPLRSLIVFPFLLVFAIYLFLLPLNYAVLQKRIEFPVATLVSSFEKASTLSGQWLLLNKTEQEFILWDQVEKKALWIPKDKVVKVEIGRPQAVFKRELPKTKEVR